MLLPCTWAFWMSLHSIKVFWCCFDWCFFIFQSLKGIFGIFYFSILLYSIFLTFWTIISVVTIIHGSIICFNRHFRGLKWVNINHLFYKRPLSCFIYLKIYLLYIFFKSADAYEYRNLWLCEFLRNCRNSGKRIIENS